MRNSQISSVNSKFETWGLEKANLKLIDLSDNRNVNRVHSKLDLVGRGRLTDSFLCFPNLAHVEYQLSALGTSRLGTIYINNVTHTSSFML